MNRKLALTVVVIALAWYALLGLRHPARPGLHYDECRFAAAPIAAGGIAMQSPGVGKIKSWLMQPLLGSAATPASIRAPMVLVGLIALVFTALLAFRFFGPRESALVTVLLAFDPFLLHHVREDWGPSALGLLLRVTTLLLVLSFTKNGRGHTLLAAAFVAGLGVWNTADFLFFLIPLIIAAAIWLRTPLRDTTQKSLWFAIVAFFVGASPALLYWLTYRDLTALSLQTGSNDFSATALAYKAAAIFDTLRGTYPVRTFLGETSITTKRTLLPHVLIAGAFVLAWLRCKTKTPVWRDNTAAFLATLLGSQLLLLLLVPHAYGSHHFFTLTPTAHLLAAVMLIAFLDHAFKSKAAKRAATALLLAPILLIGLVASVDVEAVLDDRGGAGAWSPAIADLADIAQQHPDARFVFLDWGMTTQLLTLNGRFEYDEIFRALATDSPGENALQKLDERLRDDSVVFVAHGENKTVFAQPMQHLLDRMAALNLSFNWIETINDTDGKTLFHLFRATP